MCSVAEATSALCLHVSREPERSTRWVITHGAVCCADMAAADLPVSPGTCFTHKHGLECKKHNVAVNPHEDTRHPSGLEGRGGLVVFLLLLWFISRGSLISPGAAGELEVSVVQAAAAQRYEGA